MHGKGSFCINQAFLKVILTSKRYVLIYTEYSVNTDQLIDIRHRSI